MKPLVDLVIPLYNEERRFLRLADELVKQSSAIASVFNEVILVNDGSSDKTSELCRRLVYRKPLGCRPPIRFVSYDEHRGKGSDLWE